jgi:putative phage-type endonuclease
MENRNEFLEARQSGLGGSDIGAVLSLSPYKSALDVYFDKVEPKLEQEHQEHFYWGHALEQPIAERFTKEHPDFKLLRDVPIARHPKHEWMLANVDGMFVDDQGKLGILEIKTVNAFASYSWGFENTDQVPLSYAAQVAHYMAVMNVDYAIIAALFGGSQYKEYRIERDSEIESVLIHEGGLFWHNHVIPRIPPEPKTADDVARLFKHDLGTILEADDNLLNLCQEIKRLKSDAKDLDGLIVELTTNLKKVIGDAALLQYAGSTICSWKNNKDSVKVDWQALVKELNPSPELVQKYTKTVPGIRPLLLK